MSGMMKAAVLAAPGSFEIREQPVPSPAPDEVLIRVEGCGVCASNIPLWEGREWFSYPLDPGSPGHEGWGRVVEAGGGVRGVSAGDRVAFLSYHSFAEYDRATVDSLALIPEEIGPFPGEPVGCAVNVFRRSDIRAGQTVAVIGIGFLGAVLTSLAAAEGARVIALSRRPFSLELARSSGAESVIALDDHWRIIEEVKSLTGGKLCDRVIESTGLQWPLDLAGELTRERGRLVIAGFHQDGPRQVNLQLWNWRGLDVINAHERDPQVYLEGIRQAVEEVACGRLDISPLCTHRYPLEQMSEAYRALVERPDGFVKGMVMM